MGARGPLPKPQSRRQQPAAGRRKRPPATTALMLPSTAALRPMGAPPVPPGLAERGRETWDLIWADGAAWLAPADAPLAARFCELVEEIAVARRSLAEDGLVLSEPLVSPRGDVVGSRPVANPAARALRDSTAQLAALAGALGLSPAARARLGLTVAQARRLADGRAS